MIRRRRSRAPDTRRRPRPGRTRRWLLRPLVWIAVTVLAVLAAGDLFLASGYARQRVRALLAERLSRTLGRPVEVGRLDYSLVPLELTAEDVAVAGPHPGDRPLATAAAVRVTAALSGLRPFGLRVTQVDVERPEVYLHFAADGSSNLPEIPAGSGGARRVEVSLERLLVEGGTLQIDERRLPLDIAARAVWGRLGEDGSGRYRVLATAQEVATTLPDARPVHGTASLKGTLHGGGAELASGRFTGRGFDVRASGSVTWGEGGRGGELAVSGEGAAELADRLGYLKEPIEGAVRFRGRVRLGEAWSFQGELSAPRLGFLDRRFTDVAGRVSGHSGSVEVDVVRAGYAGGELAGSLRLDLAAEPAAARLDATLRGVVVRSALADAGLPLGVVAGRADGGLTYRFTTAAPLAGDGEGQLRIAGLRTEGRALEVAGSATLSVRDGVVSSRAVRLTAPGQVATGSLRYALEERRGRVEFRVESEDLPRLALALPPAAPGEERPWLPTAGSGELAGELGFEPAGPSARVGFDLRGVEVGGIGLDGLDGSFRWAPGAVDGLEARARRGGGRLDFRGRVALPEPGGPEAPGLELSAEAEGWPLAEVASVLAPDVAVAGTADGRLEVAGSLARPRGSLELRSAPLAIAGVELTSAEAHLSMAGSSVSLERLAVEAPAGRIEAAGSFDTASHALDLAVRAPTLDLARPPFADLAPGALRGRLAVDLELGGTVEAPRARLELTGSDLALGDRSLGEGGATHLAAEWSDGRLSVRGSPLGLVEIEGGGPFERQRVDLALSLAVGEVGSLLAVLAPEVPPGLDGSLSGTLRVTGRLDRPAELAARLELPRVALAYEGHHIESLEPVVARLEGSRLIVDSFYLGEPASTDELFVAGSIDLSKEGAPLDLKFQGTLGAAWIEPLLPGWGLAGRLEVLATVRGTTGAPRINGEGQLHDGRVTAPGFPHSLDRLSATVLFYPDQVVIDDLTGELGGGQVRAAGEIALSGADRPLSYRFQATGERVTLRYPAGWILRGGTELALTSTEGGRLLRGTVTLERAYFVQDVNVGLTALLGRLFQRERLEVAETDEELAATQLSLSIEGPDALRVKNKLADLRGSIDLSLRGSLARPVVFGQVEAEPGGKIAYRGNDYTVERGLLTFANPSRIEPVVDLVAETEIKPYDIRLTLSGTLERLNASFSSEPPLADLDILGLLTTGSAFGSESLAGRGGASSPFGAESFLYGQAASAISERVNSLFGLDRFRINPVPGGGDVGSSIGLTIEKRLSSDLSVIYTRDPSTPEVNIIQISWEVNPGLTFILTQEGSRSYAVDALWEKSF